MSIDGILRLQSLSQNLDGTGTANDNTYSFNYNPASQLATRAISNGVFAYPVVSSNTSYTPNGLNQYSTIVGASTITPQYDANANMKFDGTTTYGYDSENRLVSATSASGTTALAYDPNGRLIQIGTGAAATHFLYDGDALVAEYSDAGVLQARYVHGSDADEPLVAYNTVAPGSTGRSYLYANHQGSVEAVTDSNGTTSRISTYDSYGIPATTNGGRRSGVTSRPPVPPIPNSSVRTIKT